MIKQITKSLQEFVKIPSKFSTPEKGAPRGKFVKRAIEYAVELGKKLGFSDGGVIDGVVGWLEVGKGKEDFAILCHADIVPEGNGWSVDPFGGEIIDGKIYGRGVLDDKGPTLCAMYAVHSLIKSGKKPTKKIRIIIGGDEEGFPKVDSQFALNDMDAIDVYKQYKPIPKLGFSPDADFPVIYAEKGILHLVLTCKKDDYIQEIKGGERVNIVPNYAYAICDNQKISENGVSAHGSTPELGKNAIVGLLKELKNKSELAKKLYAFFECTNGNGLGINCKDVQSGELSLNVGVAQSEEDNLLFTLDIRYPVTKNKDEILSKIKSVWIGEVDEIAHKKPLFVDTKDELVLSLLASYREVTGDMSEPIAIGGGTYARELEKGVAFGASFPNQQNVAHEVDECVYLSDLQKTFEIYKKAIEKLCF